MKKNELMKVSSIEFIPGVINFKQYDVLLDQAEQVAEMIKSVVVTEDSVQESKKLLARSRKSLKTLNDERIRIKKELLKPYDVFAEQIKNIEKVVDEANQNINKQVRMIEEVERLEKKKEIEESWDKIVQSFDYKDLINFDHFFEERHLNKSVSISKIEKEINDFLETVGKDLDYLKSKGDEYVAEYLNNFDLNTTLQVVEQRKEVIEKINETKEENEIIVGEKIEKAIFEIEGKANIKLVELLLKENEINYRKIESE